MQIPEETINLIRERCRIEDVVTKYIPSMSKHGRYFKGLCPFHKEKTPSFTVDPEKQIFHCFGCNIGGNIFSFIQKIENVNFPESVIIAGDIAGISVKRNEGEADFDKSAEIIRINQYAARLYSKYLLSKEGDIGYQYLISRGVSKESIEEFQLGFAPELWDFLLKKLMQKKAQLKLAEQCGLISESQKKPGKLFDVFRNRVIFPINDATGKVIAFGGRVLGDAQPKYLNSPESPIFQKRSILYGFDKAKAEISESKRVIIVEGYLDVIGCHQGGIKNVVAPLGTALTEQHVRMLSRYCTEIVLLFDADSAGLNAAFKSIDVMKDINIDIKVAALPESDPFEFITNKGVREFMVIVDSSKNTIDFRIERIVNDTNIKKNPIRALTPLFEVIKTTESESDRSIYLKKISSILNLDENSVRLDFSKYLKKEYRPVISENNQKSKNEDFMTTGYRSLVSLLCNYPHLIGKMVMDFQMNEVDDAISKNFLIKMAELYSEEETVNINKLFDILDSSIELNFLSHSLSHGAKINNPDSAYEEIYLNMRLHKIDGEINKYADLINNGDSAVKHEYLTEIEVLRRDKEKLSQYLYNRRK